LEEHGEITEADIQRLLELKRTRAYTVAKQLCDEGQIVPVGRGKEKKYRARGL
jgi:ATP-dependent DNA helicase RecG